MGRRIKTTAYIIDVSDADALSFARDEWASVKYEFEVNGIKYTGYDTIAPLLVLHQGVPSCSYIRGRYIGGRIKIYYNPENPKDNSSVWGSRHRKELNWLTKKGGTWIILFTVCILIPLLTWLVYDWYWNNQDLFYELLGGLYG